MHCHTWTLQQAEKRRPRADKDPEKQPRKMPPRLCHHELTTSEGRPGPLLTPAKGRVCCGVTGATHMDTMPAQQPA